MAVTLFGKDLVLAKKSESTKVDGITFVKGDSVTFTKHFYAYKDASGKGKKEHVGGTYAFQFEDSSGKVSPYAFKDRNGSIFYIKKESMPRDYILFHYYPNGGSDKKNKAFDAYANGDGTSSRCQVQIKFL